MKKIKSVFYILKDIGDGREPGYQAIVPTLHDAQVYGDSIEEVEAGIKGALKYEKISYEKLVGCEIIKTTAAAVSRKSRHRMTTSRS